MHIFWQPGSRFARKWRENEKMKRKWRENGEMERKWRGNGERMRKWREGGVSSLTLDLLFYMIIDLKRSTVLR